MQTIVKIAATSALIALGSAALAGGVTVEATPPPVAPPPAPAPAANWTGFYAGATLGFAWSQANHCDQGFNCTPGAADQPDTDPQGAVAGIMLGYNHQFANDFVLGIEGDYNFTAMEGSFGDLPGFNCGGPGQCVTEVENFATLRARFGYAFGRTMPYITGGVATTSYYGSINGGAATGSGRITQAVAGAGIEHMIGDRWTVRGEVIHFFDPQNGDLIQYDNVNECGAPGCALIDFTNTVARVGVAYRF